MSLQNQPQLPPVSLVPSPPAKSDDSIRRMQTWLQSWKDVLIAELLNLCERRRYDVLS